MSLGEKMYAAVAAALVVGGLAQLPDAKFLLWALIPIALVALYEWGKSEGRKSERRR
jgi:hypothetical protein